MIQIRRSCPAQYLRDYTAVDLVGREIIVCPRQFAAVSMLKALECAF